MKILLDLRCLSQPKTGLQIVAANLLTALLASPYGRNLTSLVGEQGIEHARLDGTQILRSSIAPYDFRRRQAVRVMNDSGPRWDVVTQGDSTSRWGGA